MENERLISIIPNKGISVTDVSLQELKDVFEIKKFLVSFVGKTAIQRITLDELNKVKEILEKIKRKKRNKLILSDSEFHDLLNFST